MNNEKVKKGDFIRILPAPKDYIGGADSFYTSADVRAGEIYKVEALDDYASVKVIGEWLGKSTVWMITSGCFEIAKDLPDDVVIEIEKGFFGKDRRDVTPFIEPYSDRTTGKFILKGSGSNFVGTDHSADNFETLLGLYSTREKAKAAEDRAREYFDGKSNYCQGKCDCIWIEEPTDAYDVDVDLWEFDR